MSSQNDIAKLVERIHQAAARSETGNGTPSGPLPATTAARVELPPLPALPVFPALAMPDPVPLAEAANMVPRAREKLKAGAKAPRMLRPMFRNQGGFNGILLETCNRLVEVSQQLRQENNHLRGRLDSVTDYLVRERGWLETLAQHQSAAAEHVARFDRAEVRLDHLEHQGDAHTGALARFEAQGQARDTWMQNLQAHLDEGSHAQLAVADVHSRLDEHVAVTSAHAQAADSRFEQMGVHLHSMQDQTDRHAARLDETHDREAEIGDQTTALKGYTGEIAAHLHLLQGQVDAQVPKLDEATDHIDTLRRQTGSQAESCQGMAAHLNSLQEQVYVQIAQIDEARDRVSAVAARGEDHTGRLDQIGSHLNSLQENLHSHVGRLDENRDRLNDLQAQAAHHVTRGDEISQHLNSLQEQSYQQAARLDEASDHAKSAVTKADATHDYTREVHGHLDQLGRYFDELKSRMEGHVSQFDTLHSGVAGHGAHLGDLQKHAESLGDRLAGFESVASRQGEHLNGLQHQADRLAAHLGDLQAHNDRQSALVDSFHEKLGDAVRRTEKASVDFQKATSHQHVLEQNSRRLDERQMNDSSYLRAQLSFHQRLFSHWLAPQLTPSAGMPVSTQNLSLEEGATDRTERPSETQITPVDGGERTGATSLVTQRAAASTYSQHEMDALYLAFEDAMRGNRSEIKERLSYYLPYLESAHVGSSASPVLDLGCGRGNGSKSCAKMASPPGGWT